jgi:hypothetical protein
MKVLFTSMFTVTARRFNALFAQYQESGAKLPPA